MKISSFIATAALVCGSSAFAAQSVMDTETEAGRTRPVVAEKQAAPAGGGVVEKTKNALRRMGDKMRHAGHRVADKTKGSANRSTVRDDEHSPDTRAMGGAGTSRAEQARRARMDEAYSHWQSKQK